MANYSKTIIFTKSTFKNKIKLMVAAFLLVLIRRLVWLTAILTLTFGLFGSGQIGFAEQEEAVFTSGIELVGQQAVIHDNAAASTAIKANVPIGSAINAYVPADENPLSDIKGHWAEGGGREPSVEEGEELVEKEDKELWDYAVSTGLLAEEKEQASWIAMVATRADGVVILDRLREILGMAI
ncbi:hypothetical protein [Paenibacillus agricola]|uniref:Uncharacterized protein n=1 Tax=Paenibacillus agricola TaxID=2716264 RepID=A0ABX0JC22_9BACL|nr:hypothetical protein [Paenibacillus agricola]NHN33108.1 hypothetical protein [Paenibacillus agricola]